MPRGAPQNNSGAGREYRVKDVARHLHEVPAQVLIAYVAALDEAQLYGRAVGLGKEQVALHGAVLKYVVAITLINEFSGAELVEEGGDGVVIEPERLEVVNGVVPVIVREVCDVLHALGQMQAGVKEVGAGVERDAV